MYSGLLFIRLEKVFTLVLPGLVEWVIYSLSEYFFPVTFIFDENSLGLIIAEFPEANINGSLSERTIKGKFQGIISPTIPTGS